MKSGCNLNPKQDDAAMEEKMKMTRTFTPTIPLHE